MKDNHKFLNKMIEQKNIFSKMIFLVTLYYSKEINFLYYNSSDSPDFPTYFNYFRYFYSEIENTSREQGLFYYFLNSWNFYSYSDFLQSDNFFIYLHKSIQLTNFYLFIFGLIGCYFLLKYFNFSQSTIFYTLSILNVLPFITAMRIVLKPEILAFAMLPWILICLEMYFNEKNFLFLILLIPFTVLALSSKGSVLVMLVVYLSLTYFFKSYNYKDKKFLMAIGIFLVIFAGLYVEDSNANEISLIDLQSGSVQAENYNFKAPKSIVYKVDIYRLFTSPKKYDHSGSAISITLLDTFGDYFDVYWDNDSSNYFSDRKTVFEYEKSSEIKPPNIDIKNKKITVYDQKVPDLYFREFIGLIVSIIFYICLLIYIFKRNTLSKFIFAPLAGISILLIHIITGFPVNNFDPSKGDTLKTVYYCFFLAISFIFLCAQILDAKKNRKLYIVPIIFIMIFLTGFPKDNSTELNINLSSINNYSVFCNLNNSLLLNDMPKDLISKCETETSFEILGFSEYKNFSFYKNAPKVPYLNLFLGLACIINSLYIFRFLQKYN